MTKNKGIILLSGGLDSVVSLAAVKEEYNIELALTFDYGQRAKNREIHAAKKIAEHFGIKHKLIKTHWLEEITQTALVNKNMGLPELADEQLDSYEAATQSAKNVWVPNRNGIFLNIAAGFADSYGYTHILFGANKEEGTTFPDNTQEFIDKINESFEYSTLVKPKVVAPLITLNKKEIIALGIEKKAPFDLIRSCYTDNDNHCGKCESCKRLKRAISEVGPQGMIKIIFDN